MNPFLFICVLPQGSFISSMCFLLALWSLLDATFLLPSILSALKLCLAIDQSYFLLTVYRFAPKQWFLDNVWPMLPNPLFLHSVHLLSQPQEECQGHTGWRFRKPVNQAGTSRVSYWNLKVLPPYGLEAEGPAAHSQAIRAHVYEAESSCQLKSLSKTLTFITLSQFLCITVGDANQIK